MTRPLLFPRALLKLHKFTSSFDWFIVEVCFPVAVGRHICSEGHRVILIPIRSRSRFKLKAV